MIYYEYLTYGFILKLALNRYVMLSFPRRNTIKETKKQLNDKIMAFDFSFKIYAKG